VGFSVKVTGTSGVMPTGKVRLKRGTTVLATANLNKGAATFLNTKLNVGTNTLAARYVGDAVNAASTSPALVQQVTPNGGSCP
jgi:hypothetical protein